MGQADIELGYIGAHVGQQGGETVLEAVRRVVNSDCCERTRRSMLLAMVRCIIPAIRAGEVTDALRHQVKRIAATYEGEFAVTLAQAIVDRGGPPPGEPKLIRSDVPKRYLVWPGWVTSTADGQQHYIDAPALMRLYGVNPDECIVARGYDANPRRTAENCTDLMPRRDGDYTLPTARTSAHAPGWTTCTIDGGVVYAFHIPCRRAFIVPQEHTCRHATHDSAT